MIVCEARGVWLAQDFFRLFTKNMDVKYCILSIDCLWPDDGDAGHRVHSVCIRKI